MATEQENLISAMSYTDKDFISIFQELLDLVKKLTYKYDPSISNESDPGVILTKLNAIVADKNNYNIDKNTLETFPVSVTQEYVARNLFAQLGYHMKWYRSATVPVTLKWRGDYSEYGDARGIRLPIFTMVTDDNNDTVYTLTESVDLPFSGTNTARTANAIEGVVEDYILNDGRVIKFSDLDENRRLYFTDSKIAENGIFICNANSDGEPDGEYSAYARTDNLAVVPTNAQPHYYEFGVLRDGTCFIEFPEGAERFFGDGICIKYILTSGAEGNIGSKFLTQFYSATSAPVIGLNGEPVENVTAPISQETVLLTNTVPAVNGADSETIREGYNDYKKTIGVFNTLVALRDYIEFINASGLVSNSFVCDRTDDIQYSYNIVTNRNEQTLKDSFCESAGGLTAFDLKLYCLNYAGLPSDAEDYKKSFTMLYSSERDVGAVKDYLENSKCIQHDFKKIDSNRLCYIINSFPLSIRIIPQATVSKLQADGIKNAVIKALIQQFNAHEIRFGEPASYDDIYNAVLEADPSIKSVVLEDIHYNTLGCYFDSNDKLQYCDLNEIPVISGIKGVDSPSANNLYFDPADGKVKKYTGTAWVDDLEATFKVDILTKSVLNGNTQLLIKDSSFDHTIGQSYVYDDDEVVRISTSTTLEFAENSETTVNLLPNETVGVYVPSYDSTEEYSYYIQVDTSFDLTENTLITIPSDGYVCLFWKANDSDTQYQYRMLKNGSVIKVSSAIPAVTSHIYDPNWDEGRGVVTNPDKNAALANANNGLRNLSSNNTLSVLKQVTTTLLENGKQQGYLCYWVLNKQVHNTDNGKTTSVYQLFAAGQNDYILQSGEYFFCTDSTKQSLAIFYPGTRIVRYGDDHSTAAFSCTVADISSLYSEGAESISDLWVAIPNDFVNLKVQEMEFFSVGGKGASVTISGLTDDLTVSGVTELESSAVVSLESASGEEVSVPNTTSDISRYIRSALDFVASPSYPMELSNYRQVVTFNPGEASAHTVRVADEANPTPLYILTDTDCSLDGGANIDVQRLSASGELVPLSVYVYSPATIPDGVTQTSDGYTIPFTNAVPSVTIANVKFESGKSYVIPVTVNSASISALSVSIGGTTLSDFYGTGISGGTIKKYFLKYYANSDDAVNVVFSATLSSSSSGTHTITVGDIVPYMFPEIMTSGSNSLADAVVADIGRLDTEKEFDWMYQVPTEDEIPNPLDPDSFVNEAHPFNKFTICEINTSCFDGDIKVLNIRK